MNAVELIRKKREGGTHTREELEAFLAGYVAGDIPDYQMSAWLMAVVFRGMTDAETAVFTELMLRSGTVIDLSNLPARKVDKHSTGGVGDKVSLILAPMVAACGVAVPMISGRGLGHTGGTLDKLESIPGFRTNLSVAEYRQVIAECGLVLAGQTAEVVPADRKLYALRDVTATVESIPLIAGSIMSKKLAEGIDALVLDIKTGSGAFMKSDDDALKLAQALVAIGTHAGKETVGFLTGMDQPLGFAVGNWLEVVESVECLRGRPVADLMEVTTVLGGTMVWMGRQAQSIEEGMAKCRDAIWSGHAYEKFLEIVRRQGGDVTVLTDTRRYAAAKVITEVKSASAGFLEGFDTHRLGMFAIALGAGRTKIDDTIDPRAGFLLQKKTGDRVERGEVIAVVHSDKPLGEMEKEFIACVRFAETAPVIPPLVRSLVNRTGVHPWKTPVVH